MKNTPLLNNCDVLEPNSPKKIHFVLIKALNIAPHVPLLAALSACPQGVRTTAAACTKNYSENQAALLLLLSLVPLLSESPLSSKTLGSPASAPLNTHSGTERPLLFAIDAPTAALATFSPSRNRLAGAATCWQT